MIGPQEQLADYLIIMGLAKSYRFFLNGNLFISKKVFLKEFIATTGGTQKTAQTVSLVMEANCT